MKNQSSIKKVLLNSGIYSLTNILQKGIGFLLLPLYTLYLSPEDYGITGIVNSFTTVLTLLFTLSLNGAVQRYYYIYEEDTEKLKEFLGTIILFVILNSVVIGTLIILLQQWIIAPFIDGVAFYPYIFLGVLTVIFNPIYTIFQSLLQTMQRGKAYGKNSLLHFALLVFLNILFIVVFQWGARGQLLSYLFTAIVFGVYSLYNLHKNDIIKLAFNFGYLKQALVYSVPLLPHNLASTIAAFLSQLILNNQVSTASAGLFNIATQFMMIIDIFQMSVNNAYIPWFYGEMNQGKKAHKNIVNFANMISKGYLLVSVFMSFVIKEVIQIFLPIDYLPVWTLIPIMVVAYQFKSIYLFYVNTLFYNTKSTKYIFIGSVSGSFINILVSALLTSKLGLITPAFATLAQWMVTAAIVIVLSRVIEPVNFNLRRMLFLVLQMIFVLVIGHIFDFRNPTGDLSIINIFYKIIVYVIFTFIVLYREFPEIKKNSPILQKFNK